MAPEAVGSWQEEDFTAGGYFDDKDCLITKAEVVEFDYAGKSDGGAICALAVTLRGDDAESEEDERIEYFKIGELSKFTPSADRKNYKPVGSVTSMNKTCKAALFIKALKEKGFQTSRLKDGVDGLAGVHGHVNIVPLPEMKGIDRKDLKILIFTRFDDIRDVGKIGAASKPAKGSGKKDKPAPTETKVEGTAAAAGVDGAEEKTTEVILELLSTNDGKLNKSKIPQAMFGKIPASDAKLRNACVALGGKADWLGSPDRPWTFNNGELSLG